MKPQGRIKIGILDRLLGDKVSVPIIDYLNNPLVITARDGKIAVVNKAFLELIDASRDDVIGRDCHEIEPIKFLCNVIASTALQRIKQKQRVAFRNITFEATVSPMTVDGEMSYVLIVFTDIAAFVNLEAEFLRKNRELIISNTLSGAFITSDNIDTVFSDLLEKALIISHLGMGWIMLKRGEEFELKVSSGLTSNLRTIIEDGLLDTVIEKTLLSDSPLHVFESEDTRQIPELNREGVVFFAIIPLRTGPDILGCLLLANRVKVTFDFDLASLLSLIGNNLSLIADKVKLFQETQRLAITDGLTGLYNARHFYEELEKEIARAQRYSTAFSLALFDIDDFKVLNDTYGHQAGDEVLRDVAEKILHVSRKTDVVARYGGEEFISILPNTPKEEAYKHAHRIKDSVEGKLYLGANSVRLTLSGGISAFPEDATDAKALLYAADMAMYKAKATGKNTIHCYGQT